jgi:hypothetical protein
VDEDAALVAVSSSAFARSFSPAFMLSHVMPSGVHSSYAQARSASVNSLGWSVSSSTAVGLSTSSSSIEPPQTRARRRQARQRADSTRR